MIYVNKMIVKSQFIPIFLRNLLEIIAMTTLSTTFDELLDNALTADDKAMIIESLHWAKNEQIIGDDALNKISQFFDARNMSCPMPLLKAKIALRSVGAGEALYLIASDKNSQTDLVAYCQKNSLKVATWGEEQGGAVFHFLIEVSWVRWLLCQ